MKTLFLILSLLLISQTAQAEDFYSYDNVSKHAKSYFQGDPTKVPSVSGQSWYQATAAETASLYQQVKTTGLKYFIFRNNRIEEMTQAEKDAVDAAEAAAAATALKAAAKTAVTNRDEIMLASRSGLRTAYKSLVETRNTINAIIDHLNNPVQNPVPAKLVNRTWSQVISATKTEIDNETDPNA